MGPGSFQKVRLLGKGDVGKVYLVREKKSDKLFAMKGKSMALLPLDHLSYSLAFHSSVEKRNGQAEQNQARTR